MRRSIYGVICILLVGIFMGAPDTSSGASGQPIAAPPAQTTAETIAKLLNDLGSKIGQAQAQQVNLLSPNEFNIAVENYELAKADDARGKDQKSILKKLTMAQERLELAFKNANNSRAMFTPVLKARESALEAEAPQYAASQFDAAEKLFQNAAMTFEKGDNKEALKKGDKAIELFTEAELFAIKENIIGKVHLALKKAKDEKVEKYAPSSFLKAQSLLQEAENIINSDRKKQSSARQKAEAAEYEANHASYLAKLIQGYRDDLTKWEDFILEHEALIQKIAKELKIEATQFDNGMTLPLNQIFQAVQSLNSNIKNLREELQTKNAALAEQNNEIKDLKIKLNQSKEVEIGLKDKLDVQKRRAEKIKRVENLFTPIEARVIREGDLLKIRLLGLTFDPGKATINAEFFGLLTKVQQVIREFPGAPIVIEGHTDSKGNPAKNVQISTARAEAVKAYLQANMGLAEEQIQAVGYGNSHPIASELTEDDRRQNRRTEVVIDINKSTEY
ncbi:OmpA family protein [candidate division KSB1 bacterium]|nr:OmpA family protein [candidate division KSB1 bacterium]